MTKAQAFGLAFKLIPAVFEVLKGFVDASKADSDGGKKVTRSEARGIWRKLKRRLLPIVASELEADEKDLED